MAIYSEFFHKKLVIFHSYISLPEGRFGTELKGPNCTTDHTAALKPRHGARRE